MTTNAYNSSGQVTSQTDPDGGITTWSYAGDPTMLGQRDHHHTDPVSNVTTYDYSDLELTSVTHRPAHPRPRRQAIPTISATLGVTSVTDPKRQCHHQHLTDSNGNLLSTTNPLGNIVSYSYNSFNETVTKTTTRRDDRLQL